MGSFEIGGEIPSFLVATVKSISVGKVGAAVVALLLFLVVGIQYAEAREVYRFQIDSSFLISEKCLVQGELQHSVIELRVNPSTSSDNTRSLAWASAKITVCPAFGSLIEKSMPIPLPVAIMRAMNRLSKGQSMAIGFNPKPLVATFKDGNAPDLLQVTRLKDVQAIELNYFNSSTGEKQIGPIRVHLSAPQILEKIPGFQQARNLPVQKIEFAVPEKGVTLQARIRSILNSVR